jgi:dual specificity MAP kinase phosphatase
VAELIGRIARAQEELWQQRMTEFYCHMMRAGGEGLNEPVRYGVWVLVGKSAQYAEVFAHIPAEPFHKVEKFCPHLVNIGTSVHSTPNSGLTDLFEREAKESRAMTRGSEVVEGFWVGNDCDVPGGADDGAGSHVSFDLCVKASECADMPTTAAISSTYRKLLDLDRRRHASNESSHAWVASPATVALRNILSPVQSPVQSMPDVGSKRVASPSRQETARRRRSRLDEEYVSLDCAGSCRTITGQMRNLNTMSDRVVELVYFLRKVIEGRDKSGTRRRVLVHCQDGYTESSIFVLSYIMSSLSVSLPEAFLHLQLNAKRSFFLYPSDKPLLRKIDARLAADRRAKAIKLVSSTPNSSPTGALSSRWKGWGLGLGKNGESPDPKKQTVESARDLLVEEEKGGSAAANEARVWFDDRRFDGFPSRILPFLYLGNL